MRFIREGFIEKLELEMSLKDGEGLGGNGSEKASASSVRTEKRGRISTESMKGKGQVPGRSHIGTGPRRMA